MPYNHLLDKGVSKKPLPRNAHVLRMVLVGALILIGLIFPLLGIVGIVLLCVWTSLPKWLKIVIAVPFGLLFSILFLSSIPTFIYLFMSRPYQIKGVAMYPNYTNGMYVMTDVVNQNNTKVKRSDVLIFVSPKSAGVDYIKRVVGLPGETVMLRSGDIYINGKKLDEGKYISSTVYTSGSTFLAEEQTVQIPSGQYFMLGDNRPESSDSREWGFVPRENIISTVGPCYWNCGKK
ncbi:MAG: signal peptidase I [Candidatus Roizmanbacteria bacterium]